MPQGRSRLVLEGSTVLVLVDRTAKGNPTVEAYGPYETMDKALKERRLLLSHSDGLSGKILTGRAQLYAVPCKVFGHVLSEKETA